MIVVTVPLQQCGNRDGTTGFGATGDSVTESDNHRYHGVTAVAGPPAHGPPHRRQRSSLPSHASSSSSSRATSLANRLGFDHLRLRPQRRSISPT